MRVPGGYDFLGLLTVNQLPERFFSLMKKKIIISVFLGVILSAAGFYFALRNVPFADLVNYIRSIKYIWLIPAAAVGLFTFVIRAIRWQMILGTSHRLSFFSAYHPMMVGFMINTVLPGRVGELARPAIIKKQNNVPFSLGMATIAAERMLDGITLIALFAWVLTIIEIDPKLTIDFQGYQLSRQTLEVIASAMIRVCVALVFMIIVISIPAVRRVLKSLVMKIPEILVFAGNAFRERIREKCCVPLTHVIDHVAAGFSLTRSPGKLLICLVYSFLIWSMQSFSLYLMSFSGPGIHLTFTEMTAVFIIICFFIALPSVPGFWGVWEAGGVFALALFGVPAGTAVGFALATHAILMFPVLIAGIISAVITGINIIQVSYGEESDGVELER